MATALCETNLEQNANLYDITISPYNNAIQKDYEMAGDITIANSLSTESKSVQNHNIIKTINYVKNQSKVVRKSTPSSRVLILRKSHKRTPENVPPPQPQESKAHPTPPEHHSTPVVQELSVDLNKPSFEYDDSTSSADSGSPTYDNSPESSVDSFPRPQHAKHLWKTANQRQNLLEDRLDSLLTRARKVKDSDTAARSSLRQCEFSSRKLTNSNGSSTENGNYAYDQTLSTANNGHGIEMHHIATLNATLDYDITDQINGITHSDTTNDTDYIRDDIKWVPEKEISEEKRNNINHKVAVLERLANYGEPSLSFSVNRKCSPSQNGAHIKKESEQMRLLQDYSSKRKSKTYHSSHRSICHCDSGNKCRYCTPLFSPRNKRKPSLDLQAELTDCHPMMSYISDDHAYSMKTFYQQDDIPHLTTSMSHDSSDLSSSMHDSVSNFKFKKCKRSSGSHMKKNKKSEIAIKKKKPENDFDIDNVMIPICFNSKVEKPKFKQIITPKWRLIDDAPTISHSETASVDFINAELLKDTDEDEISRRHMNSESIEKKRFTAFQTACLKPRRTRSDSTSTLPPALFSPTIYTPPKRIPSRNLQTSASIPFKPRIFPITSKEFSKAIKSNVLPTEKYKSNRSLLLKQNPSPFSPPLYNDNRSSTLYNDTEDDYVDIMHTDTLDPEWRINKSNKSNNSSQSLCSGLVLKLSRKV